MLYRLSIQNRTPEELRQLASERRELAVSKQGRVKALLLNEARLLEFHAELRVWMDRPESSQSDHRFAADQAEQPQAAAQSTLGDEAPFLTTLFSRMALPIADQHALLSAAQPRQLGKGELLAEEGERFSSFLLLCSGAARATRTLEQGGQQVVAIFLPGDALNPGDIVLGGSGASISTLTPALILSVPVAELLSLMEKRPAITRALWQETALQAAIQREWLIWLGRKPAEARVAHLLCELAYRLKIGSKDRDVFELPLTQRELADTLGLSCVHVNRVLQQLRRRKLIDLNRGRLNIRNKEGLYDVAEFDPGYLETSDAPRPNGGRAGTS